MQLYNVTTPNTQNEIKKKKLKTDSLEKQRSSHKTSRKSS